MRINAINSVMRPIRNVAAAAVVAATPLAAKADAGDLAKTNTVTMLSRNNWIAETGNTVTKPSMRYYVSTNNLPTKVDITGFTQAGAGTNRLEVVANGEIPGADILAKDKLSDGAWYRFDSLRPETGMDTYAAGTATKFSVDIPADAAESRFFKVVVPGLDANGQPVIGTTNDWSKVTITDANGKELIKQK